VNAQLPIDVHWLGEVQLLSSTRHISNFLSFPNLIVFFCVWFCLSSHVPFCNAHRAALLDLCIGWPQGSPAVQQPVHTTLLSSYGMRFVSLYLCVFGAVCSAHRAALLDLCIGWAQGSPAVEQPEQAAVAAAKVAVSSIEHDRVSLLLLLRLT
jgi:hypothetical protein